MEQQNEEWHQSVPKHFGSLDPKGQKVQIFPDEMEHNFIFSAMSSGKPRHTKGS